MKQIDRMISNKTIRYRNRIVSALFFHLNNLNKLEKCQVNILILLYSLITTNLITNNIFKYNKAKNNYK